VEKLWKPVGCRACRDVGFAGRSGVFELLLNDATIRHLCVERASAGDIREHALAHGMLTLRQCGYRRALAGDTTLEEVVRITRGDVS
jgi:general secretion pathway protein E/type IV pilus assembly protein PilB